MSFRSLKSAVAVATTLAGSAVRSIWSRHGGQGVGSRLRFLLPGARHDYEREAGDLWSNGLVAICLKWAGDNYPKPTMRVVQTRPDGSRRPLPRHPLVDLMRRPNPHYTGRVLAKAVLLSLVTDGNAYLVKVRDSYRRVVGLYWVPHWLMQPVWPEDGSSYVRAYQYLRDHEVVEVQPEDVVHFRDGLDPRNDRLGLSALKAQLREVVGDNEVSGYEVSILKNCGVPGLVIVPREKQASFREAEAKKIKEELRDTLTGDDRGDTLVFHSPVEVLELGFSPEQLALSKIGERSQYRICSSVGIDPMVVGLPSANKTYANHQSAVAAAWRQCLVPLGDLVAEQLGASLLPEFDDPATHSVEFDYSQVEALQEDLALKHARVREDWKAGLVRHAEACALLGYQPDPEDPDRYHPGTGALDVEGPAYADADDADAEKSGWSY